MILRNRRPDQPAPSSKDILPRPAPPADTVLAVHEIAGQTVAGPLGVVLGPVESPCRRTRWFGAASTDDGVAVRLARLGCESDPELAVGRRSVNGRKAFQRRNGSPFARVPHDDAFLLVLAFNAINNVRADEWGAHELGGIELVDSFSTCSIVDRIRVALEEAEACDAISGW